MPRIRWASTPRRKPRASSAKRPTTLDKHRSPRQPRRGRQLRRVNQRRRNESSMKQLFKEILHNKLLWLLVFVPAVFAAEKLKHEAHTLHFVLSVLAIVPLAALLSHATESVAAQTGDAIGGLLNATLRKLTELIIALAALQAGQYMLGEASLAGAVLT